MRIKWIDSGREPKCAPNPAFPNGVEVDLSGGSANTCIAELPYPARRCGIYMIDCKTCGLHVGVTTAGRADDPRNVKLACLSKLH